MPSLQQTAVGQRGPGGTQNHLCSAEKLKASVSNEGRINVILWYCLVGAYVGLPLGVEGSPGGKWLLVV